jgi:hypothetical protein
MEPARAPPSQPVRVGPAIVAFCDIAGFISVIEAQSSIVALCEEMNNMRFLADGLFQRGSLSGPETKAGLIFVGDAFLAFAFDPTDEIREGFLRSICGLSGAMLHRGWRVRAGVVEDELLVSQDRTHYLGRAIARAHHLELGQQWFGGALQADLAAWLDTTEEGQRILDDGVVRRALIPLKEGVGSTNLAIGWPRGLSSTPEDLKRNLERLYPAPAKSENAERMLNETLRFYRQFKTGA